MVRVDASLGCVQQQSFQQPLQVVSISSDPSVWAPATQADLPAQTNGTALHLFNVTEICAEWMSSGFCCKSTFVDAKKKIVHNA